MGGFVAVLLIIAMVATLGVLAWGVIGMVRRDPSRGARSNRLMQFRVAFQAAALVLFVLAMWLTKR